MTTITLPIDSIIVDWRIYPRISTLDHTTRKYASAMKKGDKFPPIVITKINDTWYMVDGYHRINAALKIGVKEMESQVIECKSLEEAYVEGIKRNATHGEPFHPAERIIIATNLKEMGYTTQEISDILRVTEVDVQRSIIRIERSEFLGVKRRIEDLSEQPKENDPVTQLPDGPFHQMPSVSENGRRNIIPVYDFDPEVVNALAALAHQLWVEFSVEAARRFRIPASVKKRWMGLWIPYENITEDTKKSHYQIWAKKALAILMTMNGKDPNGSTSG